MIPEIFALWVKYSIPLRMNWLFPLMDKFLNPRMLIHIVLYWGNPSILMCFEESMNPKWRNIQIFYSNTNEGCKTCRLSPQVITCRRASCTLLRCIRCHRIWHDNGCPEDEQKPLKENYVLVPLQRSLHWGECSPRWPLDGWVLPVKQIIELMY